MHQPQSAIPPRSEIQIISSDARTVRAILRAAGRRNVDFEYELKNPPGIGNTVDVENARNLTLPVGETIPVKGHWSGNFSGNSAGT